MHYDLSKHWIDEQLHTINLDIMTDFTSFQTVKELVDIIHASQLPLAQTCINEIPGEEYLKFWPEEDFYYARAIYAREDFSTFEVNGLVYRCIDDGNPKTGILYATVSLPEEKGNLVNHYMQEIVDILYKYEEK